MGHIPEDLLDCDPNMSFKDFLDPEEMTMIHWAGIIFVLMLGTILFCNWLNYAVWP